MKRTIVSTILIAFFWAAPATAGAGDCQLAADLAKKAIETFETDKAAGLEAFIKAYGECPEEPKYAYNVANAYFESGQAGRAEPYLRIALEKEPDNALWLNNLAKLVMANGGDSREALKLAQRATDLSKEKKIENPAFVVTLAEAKLKNGEEKACLEILTTGKIKWGEDPVFVSAYDRMLNSILAKPKQAPPQAARIDDHKTDSINVDANIPEGAEKRPYDIAVVIGNQSYAKYDKGFGNVKFAERDADAMRNYLVKTMGYHPDNVIFKKNAELSDFNSIFGSFDYRGKFVQGDLHRFIRNSGEKKTREVFVYYSGHGVPSIEDRPPFLVPVNAKANSVESTCYSLDLFQEIVEKLPVEKKTIFLDSCFSGNTPSGPIVAAKGLYIKDLKPVATSHTAFFCAAQNDQMAAWHEKERHGLFTYFFLKGLQGGADRDGNKVITLGEMKDYLGDEVPYWAERLSEFSQTPHIVGQLGWVIAKLK